MRPYNRWFAYAGFAIVAIVAGSISRPILDEIRRVDMFRVPTPSMSPTMLVGDFLVADRYYYKSNSIELGDVVTFVSPHDGKTTYVKRCAAIGGDTVEMRSGTLFLNNQKASDELQGVQSDDQTYPPDFDVQGIWGGSGNQDHFGPVVIPDDSCFLLGDARDNSFDSRFFGPVHADDIVSKVKFLYFSWDTEQLSPRFSRIGMQIE